MCLGVFLASDSPLSLIDWSVEHPAFNVSEILPREESVRTWLKQRYVYALGSHTHCGCGFQRNEDNAPEDVAASRQALTSFIVDAMQRGPVDIYVCWNGEPLDELTAEGTLTADALVTNDDWLLEGALTHIRTTQIP